MSEQEQGVGATSLPDALKTVAKTIADEGQKLVPPNTRVMVLTLHRDGQWAWGSTAPGAAIAAAFREWLGNWDASQMPKAPWWPAPANVAAPTAASPKNRPKRKRR